MSTTDVPAKLLEVSQDITSGTERSESVRTLLSWFRAERRGRLVADDIRKALRQLGLTTKPEFRLAGIDELISFEPMLRKSGGSVSGLESDPTNDTVIPFLEGQAVDGTAAQSAQDEGADEEGNFVTSTVSDPTYRIGRLESANVKPVSVTSDAAITSAVTHMLANKFSQLPVLDGERNVRGKVSWRSIGARLSTGAGGSVVRDFLEPCESISMDASLFSAIDIILRDDCVLVRDNTQRIVGIVTAYDLSVQFNQRGEPFLLLSEIENHIRHVLADKFTARELLVARDPADSNREISDISDLSFGECVRLMEEPNYWGRLRLPIDRQVLTKYLHEVREIRNAVMHFEPEGVGAVELTRLRLTVAFFEQLTNMQLI